MSPATETTMAKLVGGRFKLAWAFLALLLFAVLWKWSPEIARLASTYCYGKESRLGATTTTVREGFEPQSRVGNDEYKRNPANESTPTVSIPLLASDPPSCSNVCGPTGTCAKTKTQCYADTDCEGCQRATPKQPPATNRVQGSHAPAPSPFTGKAGAGIAYSTLIASPMEMNAGTWDDGASHHNQPVVPYMGRDEWTKAFNTGMEFHNQKIVDNTELSEFEERIQPKYPVGDEITGVFFSTTPRPANIAFNMS